MHAAFESTLPSLHALFARVCEIAPSPWKSVAGPRTNGIAGGLEVCFSTFLRCRDQRAAAPRAPVLFAAGSPVPCAGTASRPGPCHDGSVHGVRRVAQAPEASTSVLAPPPAAPARTQRAPGACEAVSAPVVPSACDCFLRLPPLLLLALQAPRLRPVVNVLDLGHKLLPVVVLCAARARASSGHARRGGGWQRGRACGRDPQAAAAPATLPRPPPGTCLYGSASLWPLWNPRLSRASPHGSGPIVVPHVTAPGAPSPASAPPARAQALTRTPRCPPPPRARAHTHTPTIPVGM